MLDREMFFDPDDGFTQCIQLEPSFTELNGYLDITEAEFYIDDAQATLRATFVTPTIDGYADLVGETTLINDVQFRVNAAVPDGTGVMTLSLLRA